MILNWYCFYFFQSMHSSCENDPIDLEGLHESVVDSDEDLADSMDSLAIRDDKIREALEKDPVDREDPDLEILLEFTQREAHLLCFFNYVPPARRHNYKKTTLRLKTCCAQNIRPSHFSHYLTEH